MQHVARPRSATSQLPTMGFLLCGSLAAALLVAVRLQLQQLDSILAYAQISLFLLGSWLMSSSGTRTPTMACLTNAIGCLFTAVRYMRFARVAYFTKDPPKEFAPLFEETPFAYLVFAFYAAECGLLQVVQHRLLPGWVCVPLAAFQAYMFSVCNFRYLKPEQWSVWRVARIIAWHQVGMFAPYHTLSHPFVRKALGLRSSQPHAGGTGKASTTYALCSSSGAACGKQHSSSQPGCHVAAGNEEGAGCQNGVETNIATTAAGLAEQTLRIIPRRQSSLPAPVVRAPRMGTVHKGHSSVDAAVHALVNKPYQSKLRVAHKVVLKLDTHLPCEQLPHNMADSLQTAVCTSIGRATSLSITDVAVRPGCIAITLNVQELTAGAAAAAAATNAPAGPEDHADNAAWVGCDQPAVWAHALLPQLQEMLTQAHSSGLAFQRATLQLDGQRMLCTWHETKQEWQVQFLGNAETNVDSSEAVAAKPWLGIAQACSIQPVMASAGMQPSSATASASGHATQLWEVVSEVQLWGATKMTEVEGWEPPAHHLERSASDSNAWAAALSASDAVSSSNLYKMLARVGDAYLPTRALRVVPGTTPGCMTAQVHIQLSESQLVRHHAGGPPSTVLLLGLELWQQEQLLSSSMLMSVPATIATAGTVPAAADAAAAIVAPPAAAAVSMQAWWWGARNGVVAAAVTEWEQCAQVIAAAQPAEASVVQSFRQFTQDLASWLAQVQRVAGSSGMCKCAGSGSSTAFKQPMLPVSVLRQLGSELREYASYMGWANVQRMVSQQLRSVVQPAAAAIQSNNWLVLGLQATRVALLGYPCHHDEQLYKQQLYDFLSGMLLVSCTAGTVIGAAISRRAEGGLAVVSWPWMLLYLLALVATAMGRSRISSTQHGRSNPYIRWAFWFVTATCLYRIAGHVVLALTSDPAAEVTYTHVRSKGCFNFSIHLAIVLMEQIPASAVLPSWLLAVALVFAAACVMVDCMRLMLWHWAPSCVAALAVVVAAHIVLDAQLRRQLTAPRFAPAVTAKRVVTRTTTKPASKRL